MEEEMGKLKNEYKSVKVALAGEIKKMKAVAEKEMEEKRKLSQKLLDLESYFNKFKVDEQGEVKVNTIF